jgi:hypothetical protein
MLANIQDMIAANVLEPAERDDRSIREWLRVAGAYFRDSLNVSLSRQTRFIAAYEGIYTVAVAVLNYYGTRPTEGEVNRMLAIQTAFAEIGVNSARAIANIHKMHSDSTSRGALPPISEMATFGTARLLGRAVEALRLFVEAADHPSSAAAVRPYKSEDSEF